MQNRKISIEIETVRSGQPRPYADSHYEYILTVEGMSEHEVKAYCTKILRPHSQTRAEWVAGKTNEACYFSGYYTFDKVAENKYKYYVMQPFCD